ncbi:MAG: hypothetical protein ACO37F_05720 [Pirellulales bacterium]
MWLRPRRPQRWVGCFDIPHFFPQESPGFRVVFQALFHGGLAAFPPGIPFSVAVGHDCCCLPEPVADEDGGQHRRCRGQPLPEVTSQGSKATSSTNRPAASAGVGLHRNHLNGRCQEILWGFGLGQGVEHLPEFSQVGRRGVMVRSPRHCQVVGMVAHGCPSGSVR